MNIHQKKALQKMHADLCDTLDFDADLEANIVQYGLFSDDKIEAIKAENTNKRRIQRMLKALKCRGPTAFTKFIICIQDHYPWLADRLRTSYEQEVNNRAPSSADLVLKRNVELFMQHKLGDNNKLNKQVKQEISNFLLLHLRYHPHPFSHDSHSENHEQEILKKVFSMLTKEKSNGESTDTFRVLEEVSLDMIASEISRMYEQLKSVEMQLDYYKTLDTTRSLDEIVKDLAAQNEFKLKTTQDEITRLEREIRQKDRTIQDQSKKLEQLNSQIQELKMMCQHLKQMNSHQQRNTPSKSNDFENVALEGCDLGHEEAPNTSTSSYLLNEEAPNTSARSTDTKHRTKLPSIHPEKYIRSKKKRGQPEWKSCPNGIGTYTQPSTHHRMWKY
ncbi:hypothetical protein ACJMK2_004399 [Sinanodonta woodiana]|uniref:CARD domain-containing protein n=1 Tax=Sinanodonta woodiana TaxID=1069815 RepID=A0ABD3Y396_SINWO